MSKELLRRIAPRREAVLYAALRTLPLTAGMAVLSVCAFAIYKQNAGDACRTNLKQFGLGIMMYIQDYDERYPPMKYPGQLTDRIMPYVKNKGVLSCPDTGQDYLPNPALNYVDLGAVAAPAATMMLRDARAHSDAGTSFWDVAYADGHVTGVLTEPPLGKPAPTLPPLKPAHRIRQQLELLKAQRRSIDIQIRALELEQKRMRRHRGG